MSDVLNVVVVPSRHGIARQGGSVHLALSVSPPAPVAGRQRRKVALALVIDRSGSMASPALLLDNGHQGMVDPETPCSLDFVKEAALRMVDQMADGDAVAIVTFDDHARVEKPLTVLSARTRPALVATVRAIATGGSTNLELGLRAGLGQAARAAGSYNTKVVLLSDGAANVGECRPAVLGEIAAGAAHDGVTIAALGVGVDYHLALMSHLAECGNGDFHHVDRLEELGAIMGSEFLNAAAATARNVELTVSVPHAVAVGGNLNRLPQVDVDAGVRVSLGDVVRPREVLLELTTPVRLSGAVLPVDVLVNAQAAEGQLLQARQLLELPILSAAAAARLEADVALVARVADRLQAKADMDVSLASEAGDVIAAKGLAAHARDAAGQLTVQYGTEVAQRADVTATVDYLTGMVSRLDAPQDASAIKSRFAMAGMSTRGLGQLLGPCPACGAKASYEIQRGNRVTRSCSACGHKEVA